MAKRPHGRGDQFAREARIGLTILACLVGTLFYVAQRRFSNHYAATTVSVSSENQSKPKIELPQPRGWQQGQVRPATLGANNIPNRRVTPATRPSQGLGHSIPESSRRDSHRETPTRTFGSNQPNTPSPTWVSPTPALSPSPSEYQKTPSAGRSNLPPNQLQQPPSLTTQAPSQPNSPTSLLPQNATPAVLPRLPRQPMNEQNWAPRGGGFSATPNGLVSQPLPNQTPAQKQHVTQKQRVTQKPLEVSLEIGSNEDFWTLSERAYGSGQYYRALHASVQKYQSSLIQLPMNRRIVIPKLERLQSEFPALMPGQTTVAGPRQPATPFRVDGKQIVVLKEISLFDLARETFGQASRYTEWISSNQARLPYNVGPSSILPVGTRLVIPVTHQ